jgi:hypothetical protein
LKINAKIDEVELLELNAKAYGQSFGGTLFFQFGPNIFAALELVNRPKL